MTREAEEEKLAGWVARTRPLSGPLSPRGPQPVLGRLEVATWTSQWAAGAILEVPR